MKRGWVGLVGGGTLLLGYFLGQRVGPAPIEFPDAGEIRNAAEMEHGVAEALQMPRAFPRAVSLVGLLKGLTEDNVAGAARVVSGRVGGWDPIDLQLFLAAWVNLDPVGAIREIESWPIRSRRELGFRIVIREWAARGDWLAAVNYVQTSADTDMRVMAFGPLVKGWVLGGDPKGALIVARRLWDSDQRVDVVDSFVRGVLQAAGPEAAIKLAREMEPNTQSDFEQRFARVTLNLVAREDSAAAVELYDSFISEGTPAWMEEDVLDRLVEVWRNNDPKAPVIWLIEHEATAQRDRLLTRAMAMWGIHDMDSAWKWFEETRVSAESPRILQGVDALMLTGLFSKLARKRPVEASEWVMRLPPGPNRNAMLLRVAKFWSHEDESALANWIDGLEIAPKLRAELRQTSSRGHR